MRSWLIPSLVLVGGMLLPTVGWAQPRPAAQARVAPAPATEGGNMDEVVRIDPSQLVCADGRSLCEVTASQTQSIEALRSEVVALRTQVTTVAARTSPQRPRTTTPPGRATRTSQQPPPVLVRVRRLEEAGAATAERLEAAARDIPALTVLQAQCTARQNNPAFVLPPGTDCDAVARDLAAAQAAAARPAVPSVAAASLILR